MTTLALIRPVAPSFRVTTGANGQTLVFGDASESSVGCWLLEWVPDASFAGSFAIVGRSRNKAADDANVGYGGVPYRRLQLDGLASDYAIVGDTLGTGQWMALVPANGLSVGLFLECTNGFGTLYSTPLEGPSAP